MATDNDTNEKEPEQEQENVPEESGTNEVGESGTDSGADSSTESVVQQPAVDYAMIMETLSAVQANQAKMSAQIQKLTDAQSVMVDAGAVIREGADTSSSDVTDDKYDGFVSIDDLDLSI